MSASPEPSFALLGLRVRLGLARTLTDVAARWIDDPGLPEAAPGGPCWQVLSARDGTGAHLLRAILADSLAAPAFVTAAFHAVLGRSPDPAGLATYTAILDRDPGGRLRLLEALANSAEAGGVGETFRFGRGGSPASP